jgi:primosomal protein N' (replication factor Y)
MTQLVLLEDTQSNLGSLGYFSAVTPPLPGEYVYAFDSSEVASLVLGAAVAIPLGKRVVAGYVVSVNSQREMTSVAEMQSKGIRIKKIPSSAEVVPAFTAQHLPFFEWFSQYYSEPLSKVVDLAIPTPAWGRADPFYKRTSLEPSSRVGPSQRAILDFLEKHPSWMAWSQIKSECSASATTMRSLLEKGLVEKATEIPLSDNCRATDPQSLWETLTDEQKKAAAAIREHIEHSTYSSFLLHGVTGSGKTEVYLELIIEALKRKRSALIIVPEIALTPQLTDRFCARLKQPVAVLHSSLKPSDRWKHWSDLLTGRVSVAIGARSALFAPMKDLGIVIVDEEHDGSFKQSEGIRYNARDLALVRAKLASCPVVLGSATPSLETFHNSSIGKHTTYELSSRFFGSKAPQFEIVDLSQIKPWHMPSKNVSPPLLKGLQRTLAAGEQAFVLYNRRGFASYLQCNDCEAVIGCPHCSVTLTYHRKNNSLLCHFCGFSAVPPVVCSACGKRDGNNPEDPLFSQRGAGTERVFEELQKLLPEARLAKLDRDAVQSLQDYTTILSLVRERKVDILIGTQMIAKGHDLPDVTYVGVVDCDVGLHVPDFRASERAFQLLTQVAGRAGRRDKQGHILFQTRVPTHSSLTMTASSNYGRFAREELALRKVLGYPPFQRLLRVIAAAEDKSHAEHLCSQIAARATEISSQHHVTILGPTAAPLEKVKNLWRYHILCKSPSISVLQHIMRQLKAITNDVKNARVVFDLEPQDML